jgi:hypothetical protein
MHRMVLCDILTEAKRIRKLPAFEKLFWPGSLKETQVHPCVYCVHYPLTTFWQ